MAAFTIFFLSPANLGGERAGLVLGANATFPLARQLRSPEGAPLGDVFSFVSGLYFRGKLAYARALGSAPEPLCPALVISPAEGLRFAHEPVTVERLRQWAKVPIDASNPSFTQPLVAHARALERRLGDAARFVLLGSVASDKYVQPLTEVFGSRLLFPSDFVGRGDMSRGSLLLRAARAGSELAYAPIVGSPRRGARPAVRDVPVGARSAASPPELAIFIGLPGAGKTTFYEQRFAASHVHVNKDSLPRSARAAERQLGLVAQALASGRSVVVDNTHVAAEDRASLIRLARHAGVRVIGYFFDTAPHACVVQNQARRGRAKVPAVAIFAAARRLVPPELGEGFDELYTVQALSEGSFEVTREADIAALTPSAPDLG